MKFKALLTAAAAFAAITAFSVSASAVSKTVAINEKNFPDTNFRSYVSENFDTNKDGKLSKKERKAVTKIDVARTYDEETQTYKGKVIKSLKGIKYFTELTYLDCNYNQLTSLDISTNTKLTVLGCNGNQLTKLDVSKNTKLTQLFCHSNQLTSLDVSKNTKLEQLECSGNQLTKLNVSKNTKLKDLYLAYNQLSKLNISKNTKLTRLVCGNNQLKSLDLSNNTELTALVCYNVKGAYQYYNLMTELDVSNCTKLTYLNCDGIWTLKNLYISMNVNTNLFNNAYVPENTIVYFM